MASLDAAILQIEKGRGIPVADTGSTLNGPNRDVDPYDRAYLFDGVHEDNAGAKIVADVFRKLGYDLIIPLAVNGETSIGSNHDNRATALPCLYAAPVASGQ